MLKKIKLLAISLALALVVCVPVHAEMSAGHAADALITTGQGIFTGIFLATDGTNSVTVAIYDGTDNTGSALLSSFVVTSGATDRVRGVGYDKTDNVRYFTGIYVDITTAGTVSYDVTFIPE